MVFEILRGSVVSHRVGSSLLGDAAASSHRVHEVEDTTTLCGKCIHVSPHCAVHVCICCIHMRACMLLMFHNHYSHVYCTWSCVLYMVMCIVHGHVYCTWSCALYMVMCIVHGQTYSFLLPSSLSPNQAGVVTTKETIPSPKQS